MTSLEQKIKRFTGRPDSLGLIKTAAITAAIAIPLYHLAGGLFKGYCGIDPGSVPSNSELAPAEMGAMGSTLALMGIVSVNGLVSDVPQRAVEGIGAYLGLWFLHYGGCIAGQYLRNFS